MNQKLKTTPGIYLAGHMGSGKSTVGRLLAERLGWDFVDLDDAIEALAGRTIAAVFESDGEEAFRDFEHAALRAQTAEVRCGRPRVVALGGGTFAFARNRDLLDGAGLSVWLDASAEALWERVRGADHRPLAQDREAFAALLESRRESYALADMRVDAGQAPEASAEAIGRASGV